MVAIHRMDSVIEVEGNAHGTLHATEELPYVDEATNDDDETLVMTPPMSLIACAGVGGGVGAFAG